MAKKRTRKSVKVKEQAVLRLLKGLRQKKQKAQGHKPKKPGPKVQVDDKMLLPSILEVMTASPFVTEGVKKVHARPLWFTNRKPMA